MWNEDTKNCSPETALRFSSLLCRSNRTINTASHNSDTLRTCNAFPSRCAAGRALDDCARTAPADAHGAKRPL
jgi:hypothetical protein